MEQGSARTNVPGSVVRAELRRRTASLLVLAALVAIVVAAVAGSLAGAYRTITSIDRFRSWAHASDGSFQLYDDSQLTDLRRRLGAAAVVEQTATRRLVNAFFDGRPISDIAIFTDPGGRFGRTVDRVRVLEGRMPRADEPDAIALNELAADLLDIGPGADLPARTWNPDDLAGLFAGNAFPGFHGPALRLHVVGVVRTLDGLTADIQRTSPYAFAGPRFLAAHPGIGVWPAAVFVRTKGGAADFRQLGNEIARHGVGGTGQTATDVYQDTAQQAADDSASGLVVFAIAAAAAGAFIVGQAIQRHLMLGVPALRQLVDLGMTRTQVAVAAGIPLALAALLGSAAGIVVSAVLSPLLPIGIAGHAEIQPGLRIDAPILVAVGLAAVLLVAVFTLAAARSAVGRVRRSEPARDRVPVFVRFASRVGVPPAVGTGVHLATERRAASGPVPVRSALVGATLAVIAVVGATVVAQSEAAFVADPARWGRTWYSEPDTFRERVSPRAIASRAASVAGVAAVARFESDTVRVDGRDTPVFALHPLHGRLAAAVRRGRLPRRVDEIALGERTLRLAGARIGSTVRVRGLGEDRPAAARAMTVTGTVVIPPIAGEPGTLNTGSLLTSRALHTFVPADEVGSSDFVLRYRAGVDVAALERRLSHVGMSFNPFTEPQVPGSVRRLSDVRTIAIALGWFFVALGVLGLLHTLWVASRRHRREFAVLRVLGMRRRQLSGAVIAAALLLALAAVVIGVPVGVVVGRAVWHGSTDSLGALTDPVTPWLALLLAGPITLGVAALLAWWPARRAGRVGLARSLRTE